MSEARRRLLQAGLGTLLLPAGAPPKAAPATPPRPDPLARGDRVNWPQPLPLLDGGLLDLQALHDQAVVLVFWASYCPFCRRHNPHVQALHRAAAGKPLRVLTASFDRPEAARAYLRQNAYDFPVTLEAKRLAPLFSTRDVLPLTVVIDRGGRLREVIPGEMFAEDVAELIRYADRPA
ncbi:TlpA disulfide reductase family protein [Aquariibacter albus]|uniref:TlpA family protein disulfide reductase n=1 Tax=Aquariibacter albus TaxID=2759899 RepID=A0A839HF85_9BURK|nr:TlpA disulfide reductase family protein [Aquariibacter albus]MBB1160405.1 TlpA family protein disulfide reductase [Aquariibacter albus]